LEADDAGDLFQKARMADERIKVFEVERMNDDDKGQADHE
jgi:hypothetical protein